MSEANLAQFADRLDQIMPVFLREFARHQAAELYKGKITMPQFLTLVFINGQGQTRMTDLARFMHVTTAAVTGTVDRLVNSGYCARVFEPNDRRIIKVKLTSKGVELIKRIKEKKRRMIIDIFGRISQKEREDYLRIITHIHQILTEDREVRAQ